LQHITFPKFSSVVDIVVVGETLVTYEAGVDDEVNDVTDEDADEQAAVTADKTIAKTRPMQNKMIFLIF